MGCLGVVRVENKEEQDEPLILTRRAERGRHILFWRVCKNIVEDISVEENAFRTFSVEESTRMRQENRV